jgi:hypothetical protein
MGSLRDRRTARIGRHDPPTNPGQTRLDLSARIGVGGDAVLRSASAGTVLLNPNILGDAPTSLHRTRECWETSERAEDQVGASVAVDVGHRRGAAESVFGLARPGMSGLVLVVAGGAVASTINPARSPQK